MAQDRSAFSKSFGHGVAAAALVLAYSATAKAAYISSVNYTSHVVSGNDVTVSTGGSGKIRITVAHPDVARVWVDSSGAFSKGASYAVETESWSPSTFTVNDKGTYVQILTSSMSIRVNKSPLGIGFYEADDSTPVLQEKSSGGVGLDQAVANWNINSDEHFFGGGGDNDICGGALDRTGTSRNLYTGMVLNDNCGPAANFPVPFFMSSGKGGNAYGVYYDNTYRGQLDFGKSTPQTQTWKADGGETLFYFFNGPSFKTILDRYTELTGRAPMLPLWAMGYIQSKCWYTSWNDVDHILNPMRSANIPVDAMVLDMPWMNCYMDYNWSSGFGGDSSSAAKVASLKASGTKIMTINDPMVETTCGSTLSSATSSGVMAKCGGGQCAAGWYKGNLYDPTASGFSDWLWDNSRVGKLYSQGIAAWWLDLSEPDQEPSNTTYAAGPSAKIHNAYANLYSKAYHDGQMKKNPNDRVFILTRTGFAGIQKYGAAVWTGDIHPSYGVFAAHVPESQSAGLSGINWWANDTGGYTTGCYKNDCSAGGAQALLYQRWMQFSTFVSVFRAHSNNPCSPTEFGPGVQAVTKKYISLRYRLLPYIYSYARENNLTGAPMQRPLLFEYQNDPATFSQKGEFLFGREFLVAPVTSEATTTKNVYFPDGTWFDYDDGTTYSGKTSKTVPAPLEKLPLFVKSGAIIPMAPLMNYTGEKKWDPITLDIYPNGNTSFSLYQDDGKSLDYQTSLKYTTTQINSYHVASKSVTVTMNESNKQFTPGNYEFSIHLPAQTTTPSLIQFNGQMVPVVASQSAYASAATGTWWDGTGKVLWAKGHASTGTSELLTVSLDGSAVAAVPLDAGAPTTTPGSDAGASGSGATPATGAATGDTGTSGDTGGGATTGASPASGSGSPGNTGSTRGGAGTPTAGFDASVPSTSHGASTQATTPPADDASSSPGCSLTGARGSDADGLQVAMGLGAFGAWTARRRRRVVS